MVSVYDWEQDLIPPGTEVTVRQTGYLLFFSVKVWEEDVQRDVLKTDH